MSPSGTHNDTKYAICKPHAYIYMILENYRLLIGW